MRASARLEKGIIIIKSNKNRTGWMMFLQNQTEIAWNIVLMKNVLRNSLIRQRSSLYAYSNIDTYRISYDQKEKKEIHS